MAAEMNGLRQAKVDAVYSDLFEHKTFFSDGFRAYVLPANAKTSYVTTNEDGFRARPKSPKPAGKIRLALLGGVRLASLVRSKHARGSNRIELEPVKECR